MKKVVVFGVLFWVTLMSFAQNNVEGVIEFLGIPLVGTKSDIMEAVKKKGFVVSDLDPKVLQGQFNGEEVYVLFSSYNRQIVGVALVDKKKRTAEEIKVRYNALCRQFEMSPKYISVGDSEIPYDEDVRYQYLIKGKQYEASFYQMADVDSSVVISAMWPEFSKAIELDVSDSAKEWYPVLFDAMCKGYSKNNVVTIKIINTNQSLARAYQIMLMYSNYANLKFRDEL